MARVRFEIGRLTMLSGGLNHLKSGQSSRMVGLSTIEGISSKTKGTWMLFAYTTVPTNTMSRGYHLLWRITVDFGGRLIVV